MGDNHGSEKGSLLAKLAGCRCQWIALIAVLCIGAAAAQLTVSRTTWQPEALSLAILLLAFVLAAYLVGMTIHNVRIARLAAQLNDSNIRLAREITDRRQAESTCDANQQKYRLLVENMCDVVWTMDLSGRFTYFTPSAQKMFGHQWNDYGDFRMERVLMPESLAAVRKVLAEIITAVAAGEQIAPRSLELEQIRADGSTIWTEVTFGALYDAAGKIVGLQGITRDISERKRAQDAADQERARWKTMISGMEEGVVFADADNVIVEINDYLCRFFGRLRSDIVGKRIEDFHHAEAMQRVLSKIDQFRREIGSCPFVLQRSFGMTEVILRMQPIYRDGKYDGVLLNVIDVSELVKSRRQAEVANQAKSRFLANMSHEIRTPLTAILGYADLLMDSATSPSTRHNYLATIRRSGEHLLTLINDILDLSKIEAGKMPLTMGRCNVVALLADVASLLRPRAEQRGITFAVKYPGELPETILTDGALLRQAIVNLAGNAVKFTEAGGVNIVASFLPDWLSDQPAVRFEVIDTGVGIRQEFMARLFQPFSQDYEQSSKQYGGTGLGLAISHNIARILGGELTVKSVFGQGSAFTLTIPAGNMNGVRMLQRPSEAECETGAENWRPQEKTLAGVRVLLAEDGYDNRALIQTVLQTAGAQVECVENGRLAVERAASVRFDVVLMDMNMPEMDGYQATRALRQQGYDRPILALTANAMSGDSQQCLEAGCNAHMAKPINRGQLVRAVASYAGRLIDDGAAAGAAPTDDVEAIVSQFINDPEIAPILEGFISRLGQQLEAMREALGAGRHDDLRRLAHQLKGAGGCYGYPTLTEACKALEEAVKANDHPATETAFNEVGCQIRAVQKGYKPRVAAGTAT